MGPSDARAVVIVGGDGTACEAAGGASQSGIPIAVLPTGTENLLAKHLGLQREVAQLCEVLRGGREVRTDVAEMRWPGPAGGALRRFLVVAGIGFDAEVVRRLSALRRGHITHGDYFWPIWSTFWTHRYPRFRVEMDKDVLFDGPGLVFVGNIPRYAIGLPICGRAVPDDGKLDVCIYRCGRRVPLLWHAVKTLANRHMGSRNVIYGTGARVRVTADRPVDVQVDGDLVARIQAGFAMEFTLSPHPATFLVPCNWQA
jgi:diacylglycerol kinase family enzyme